jgi:hypothetical protein
MHRFAGRGARGWWGGGLGTGARRSAKSVASRSLHVTAARSLMPRPLRPSWLRANGNLIDNCKPPGHNWCSGTRARTHTHTHTHTHARARARTRTHTCTHAQTHKRTHKHTKTSRKRPDHNPCACVAWLSIHPIHACHLQRGHVQRPEGRNRILGQRKSHIGDAPRPLGVPSVSDRSEVGCCVGYWNRLEG